jgi:4-amino-4-deoxy-L-arabinose transferase-like glycosyltransferase
VFIAITLWWLTQDRSIPIYDAGLHLSLAFLVHHELGAGRLTNALTLTHPYPPFAYLIGSLGILIGGVGVAPPIIAENLVFVPLLALGCYKTARLAFGPLAGFLAVVFALGSPLIISQFHVFMIDAPETAMVAVSVWLILATDGFSRLGTSALAGLAVGLGMLTKEPFAAFVAGVVLVVAIRGGRESWRGMLVFAVVALVLCLPWYIHELKELGVVRREATSSASADASHSGVAPPRLSERNLAWYDWNLLNAQLYLPLFLFAVIGWVWTIVGLVRRRAVSRLAPELLVGAFVGWLVITETYLHDTRYSMPLLVYLAVFGAGWVARLPRRALPVAVAVLALAAGVNTLGSSFGAGTEVKANVFSGSKGAFEQSGTVTLAEDQGFLVAGPKRDGDLLGMLGELRRAGVRVVGWFSEQATTASFSQGGLTAFTEIAGMQELPYSVEVSSLSSRDAILIHERLHPGQPPPCVVLYDRTGVWVRLGYPFARGVKDFCPRFSTRFYG